LFNIGDLNKNFNVDFFVNFPFYQKFFIFYVSPEKKNKKRTPLDEIVNSIIRYEEQGKFDRGDFKEVCKIAKGDGSYGFGC